MLNWDQLLNRERQRKSGSGSKEYRNEFDKDYERIIYSSSLRRLQDKAQVFPLQNNDFIRTRLTHSLEVASLGRSLAWNIGDWLIKKEEFADFYKVKELASLVEVSSLVHDLGNPPFGHFGEDIIREWFKSWFKKDEFKEAEAKFQVLNPQQKNDFLHFEGNAQTIRILSKLQFLNDPYGANFTYGTLATLMKYPWASNDREVSKQIENGKGVKFGYFHAEKELFKEVSEKVGIGKCRHPATLLLEAADDIAYLTADVEDAVKKDALNWEEEYCKIEKVFIDKYPNEFKIIKEHMETSKENNVPNKNLIDVQNFKVSIQGIMIYAAVESFQGNYNQIMNGSFHGELLENSTAKELVDKLRDLASEFIYPDREVLTLELVGDRVISDLLSLFVSAVINVDDPKKTRSKHQKLVNLISENFRHIQEFDEKGVHGVDFSDLSLYNRLLLVTDFISGMTDGYAVNLHQELLGVKLP